MGSLLFELSRHLSSADDVSILCRFVAAAEQYDDDRFLVDEVDPISGSDVDPHFRYSTAEVLYVTKMPIPHGIYTSNDPRLRPGVTEPRKPSGKYAGLKHLEHWENVSVRIRNVKPVAF
jgi:hypothetical protein